MGGLMAYSEQLCQSMCIGLRYCSKTNGAYTKQVQAPNRLQLH